MCMSFVYVIGCLARPGVHIGVSVSVCKHIIWVGGSGSSRRNSEMTRKRLSTTAIDKRPPISAAMTIATAVMLQLTIGIITIFIATLMMNTALPTVTADTIPTIGADGSPEEPGTRHIDHSLDWIYQCSPSYHINVCTV
jgi:hypothetical protein